MSQEMSIIVRANGGTKKLNDLQKKGWRVEKISANHVAVAVAGDGWAEAEKSGSWLIVLRKD